MKISAYMKSGVCLIMTLLLLTQTAVYYIAANANETEQKTYFVAADGSDENPGTIEAPFKSIMKAQTAAASGDIVYIRGGVYTEFAIASTDSNYNYVHRFSKSGITYSAYENERPVFDFSSVPTDKRVAAFYVPSNVKNITFIGFDVTGVKVGTQKQSECFRIQGDAHFDRVNCYDNEANGFYYTGNGTGSLINCDAYNNIGPTADSKGNTDGFGFHAYEVTVEYCRAWNNSDDGYDCISSYGAVTFYNCWAYNMRAGGDSNGFKIGGGTFKDGAAIPDPMPVHTVSYCLSANNNESGFYSNHQMGQAANWTNNTAYNNKRANFNMLERVGPGEGRTYQEMIVDIPGTREVLHNNIAFEGKAIINTNLPPENVINNSWSVDGITTSADDFQSLDASQMTLPRKEDGSLPDITFMKLTASSDLFGMGCFPERDESNMEVASVESTPGVTDENNSGNVDGLIDDTSDNINDIDSGTDNVEKNDNNWIFAAVIGVIALAVVAVVVIIRLQAIKK